MHAHQSAHRSLLSAAAAVCSCVVTKLGQNGDSRSRLDLSKKTGIVTVLGQACPERSLPRAFLQPVLVQPFRWKRVGKVSCSSTVPPH